MRSVRLTALVGALSLSVGVLGTAACTSPPSWADGGREHDFTESQKRYTQLVRWAEFARASQYVDPDFREAFRADVRRLSELRFTDYDIRRRSDPEEQSATVHVTYQAYRIASLLETAVQEEQQWYRDDSGRWWVKPRFFLGSSSGSGLSRAPDS